MNTLSGYRNILIIKLRYVGDVLLATPVLRALRERYPAAKLTMMVNWGTGDVIKWNPDLNDVIVVDRGGIAAQLRALQQVRQGRFDCVIDLTDGDRSAILTWFTRAPVRIGFNDEHRWRGRLYTTIVPALSGAVHRVERDLAALTPLKIKSKPRPLVLHTSRNDEEAADRLLQELGVMESSGNIRKPIVVLHPGARYWFKAWPADRFAQLADRLTEVCDCKVLVAGGPDDLDMLNAVQTQAKSSLVAIAGRATLLQFAAVLKRSAAFIGNDNGAMHIAAAVGTPVVGLFGPSNPREWGPCGTNVKTIYKALDCRACFHPTCQRGEQNCMKQISVEEVFRAVMDMMPLRVRVKEG
ncbi:MAG TPA: putative lipopolysaccharide heptosyltransferase III [Nitrospiraceae bacterium]|nr:putative lipopolysaccharide heptosyltransferase III [Nitrospiraceae bacterium]